MAKLSRKITNNTNTDNNNSQNKNKMSFSLSTKSDKKEDEYVSTEDKDKKEQEIQAKTFDIPPRDEDLKNFIIEKLELANSSLSVEQLSNLLSKETKPSEKELLNYTINAIFNDKVLGKIRDILSKTNDDISNLVSKINELNEKDKKKDILTKNLTAQIADAEELVYKTEKKFADVVPISKLIKFYISNDNRNEYLTKIENLLLDSYKNGDKNGKEFTLKFFKGFVWINNAIENVVEDEKENLEYFNTAGKNFLTDISGTNSAERRPLLDIVATMINTHFNDYDFISPEQTLQIDPSIHNAEGMGGTSIKEGLSFAVVRRETRKAVYYADIVSK